MKKLLLLFVGLFCALQLSAQVMPGKEPTFRFTTDQETKLLRSADVWHDVALTSTVLTGAAACVTFIYVVESREAVNRDVDDSDKKVYTYAAAVTGLSALFSTVAWTVSFNKKRSLPGNLYILRTSPRGLVIEF